MMFASRLSSICWIWACLFPPRPRIEWNWSLQLFWTNRFHQPGSGDRVKTDIFSPKFPIPANHATSSNMSSRNHIPFPLATSPRESLISKRKLYQSRLFDYQQAFFLENKTGGVWEGEVTAQSTPTFHHQQELLSSSTLLYQLELVLDQLSTLRIYRTINFEFANSFC